MAGNRLFAALYDRSMASVEKAGLRDKRRRLLAAASGATLELGAGTGLNLEHYPAAVTRLVLTEPDPHMAKRLRERLAELATPALTPEVVETGAEDLPFEDETFDTVVSTLVLCTVTAPSRAIAEARRVLVPGGRLLFLEHVRSENERRARWQDRLERPWGWVAGGCHPNRRTGQLLADSGFWLEQIDRDRLPKAGPLVSPLRIGVARRPEPAPSEAEF